MEFHERAILRILNFGSKVCYEVRNGDNQDNHLSGKFAIRTIHLIFLLEHRFSLQVIINDLVFLSLFHQIGIAK